jgi:galactokinase
MPYMMYDCLINLDGSNVSHGILVHNHLTTLPMGKGLSSSAAVAVTVVKAFDALFDLRLSLELIMELAYLGEMLTPSR